MKVSVIGLLQIRPGFLEKKMGFKYKMPALFAQLSA